MSRKEQPSISWGLGFRVVRYFMENHMENTKKTHGNWLNIGVI